MLSIIYNTVLYYSLLIRVIVRSYFLFTTVEYLKCVWFQVVLPFVKKYYHAHKDYFVGKAGSSTSSSLASVKEKEMTARSVDYSRSCTGD